MNEYASLVGLTFNKKKTGSSYIGPQVEDAIGLPVGDIRWGFLKFDPNEKRFVIDQEDISNHIVEMRRQLASTKSVFGWVNTYNNKYMAFIFRNLGGVPANCFGNAHIAGMIDTLTRIQRELFSDGSGSAVGYLRKVIYERFGVKDLPEGYFYFPICTGGLELHHIMLDLLALERLGKPPTVVVSAGTTRKRSGDHTASDKSSQFDSSKYDGAPDNSDDEDEDEDGPDQTGATDSDDNFVQYMIMAEDKFIKRVANDSKVYAELKEHWESDPFARRNRYYQSDIEDFMTFEEFASLRESWLAGWGDSYRNMLEFPRLRRVHLMSKVWEMMKTPTTP